MAYWDRFDICDAYLLLETDYNVGGWLHERPSNQRRRESIGVQLARLHFRPHMDLSYDTMTDNGQEIYLDRVLKWKLPIDGEQCARLRETFVLEYLQQHRPEVFGSPADKPASE